MKSALQARAARIASGLRAQGVLVVDDGDVTTLLPGGVDDVPPVPVHPVRTTEDGRQVRYWTCRARGCTYGFSVLNVAPWCHGEPMEPARLHDPAAAKIARTADAVDTDTAGPGADGGSIVGTCHIQVRPDGATTVTGIGDEMAGVHLVIPATTTEPCGCYKAGSLSDRLGPCRRMSPGWWCTGDEGHDGPCAAWPKDPRDLPDVTMIGDWIAAAAEQNTREVHWRESSEPLRGTPPPDQPAETAPADGLAAVLRSIPANAHLTGAWRYDTAGQHVLTLVDSRQGQTWDLCVPKATP